LKGENIRTKTKVLALLIKQLKAGPIPLSRRNQFDDDQNLHVKILRLRSTQDIGRGGCRRCALMSGSSFENPRAHVTIEQARGAGRRGSEWGFVQVALTVNCG